MDPERLRYLFDLLDARRQPRAGVVIDLDAERDKRRRRHAVGGSIPNTAAVDQPMWDLGVRSTGRMDE